MIFYDNSRNRHRIIFSILNGFYNYLSRIGFVIFHYFLLCKFSCAMNISVEIIRMGRSQSWNGHACLCKSNSIYRMRMDNTPYLINCLIKFQMSFCVRRRIPFPFHFQSSFNIDYNHIFWCHPIIINTGRFNNHISSIIRYATNITPCVNDHTPSD